MMKKQYFLLLFCTFLLNACWYNSTDDDINEPPQSSYEPITSSRENFEETITLTDAKPILDAGKIYVHGNYLFINEPLNGFHILDNSNPENPNPIAFLNVPLATDLAMRENILYVHHAVDLVAVELNPVNMSMEVVHREKNVFPPLTSPDGYKASYFQVPENEIIIDYRYKN